MYRYSTLCSTSCMYASIKKPKTSFPSHSRRSVHIGNEFRRAFLFSFFTSLLYFPFPAPRQRCRGGEGRQEHVCWNSRFYHSALLHHGNLFLLLPISNALVLYLSDHFPLVTSIIQTRYLHRFVNHSENSAFYSGSWFITPDFPDSRFLLPPEH